MTWRVTTSKEVYVGGLLEANRVENAVRIAIADAPAPCLLNSAGELIVKHRVDVMIPHALDSLH